MGGSQRADILIVGGGTAGCVLASRLSEDPSRSVVLLEAGRDIRSAAELPAVLPRLNADQPNHDPADLWSYQVSLVDGARAARQYRGRALGGSSTVNGSLLMRGVPEDYDSWGSPLWRFDAVLPAFRAIENDLDFPGGLHGSSGPFNVSRRFDLPLGAFQTEFAARARRAGVPEKRDLNHPDGSGIGRMPVSSDGDVRTCASLAYLGPVRGRANLTVRTGVRARRIVFEGRRAVGVEVVADGQVELVRGREIVVSGGTYGSAHLLLLSGVGPAADLRRAGVPVVHDLRGVGAGMACHPAVVVRAPSAQQTGDPDVPRLGLVHSSGGDPRERNDLTLFPRVMRGEDTVLVTLRLPESSGSVRLVSADPEVQPEIRYGYLVPHDRDRLREGVRLTLEILGRADRGETSDAWLMERLQTSDHSCGTCPMGAAGDPAAVVDDRCCVHGLEGLRVIDLSIVRRSVRSGPYATVVMLAERASALVAGAS